MLLCCRRNHAGPNDPIANILLARFVILCENQTSSLHCLIILTVMFIFLTPLVVSWCARIPQILSRSQADAVYDPGRHILIFNVFFISYVIFFVMVILVIITVSQHQPSNKLCLVSYRRKSLSLERILVVTNKVFMLCSDITVLLKPICSHLEIR